MLHNYHEFETPFPPKVYGGPPPGELWVLCLMAIMGMAL